MDADYSHDSREIPKLIKPTNAGGDWLSEADIAKEAALGLEHISASSEKAANLVTKVRIDMKIIRSHQRNAVLLHEACQEHNQ